MTKAATHAHRLRNAKAAGPILALAVVVVVLVWDPVGVHVLGPIGRIDLPAWMSLPDLPDLPDLPRGLDFLLSWGKFVILAVLVVLASMAGVERRRGSDDDQEDA